MRYPILALLALAACAVESDPCGPTMGRADDGNCYPLDLGGDTGSGSDTDTAADTGDTDMDTDTDTNTDTSTDTGTDTGKDTGTDTGKDTGTDTGVDTGKDTAIDTGTDTAVDTGTTSGGTATFEGNYAAMGTVTSSAVCLFSVYDEADLDASGNPDVAGGAVALGNTPFTCPTASGSPVAFSVTASIGTSTSVGLSVTIDPDGDPTTFDAMAGSAKNNPWAVSDGATVTGLQIKTM